MSFAPSHITSVEIERPAQLVFEFVSSPVNLDRWTFGTWSIEISDDGLVHGTSLFDGSSVYVRVDPDPQRMIVDYHIAGTEDGPLIPRIMARVNPGDHIGIPDDHSVLSLMTWRSADSDDFAWHRLTTIHETEILLVKSIIEQQISERAI
ncbi:MAG: hypothetical protein GY789_09600 [Hyphomicrobiales bacterium]|nr:hypothetical protein [Hyphomicrobiales bacterium]MCP5001839.1 hypothetical protein [Hyphomicrobiales bacterium]